MDMFLAFGSNLAADAYGDGCIANDQWKMEAWDGVASVCQETQDELDWHVDNLLIMEERFEIMWNVNAFSKPNLTFKCFITLPDGKTESFNTDVPTSMWLAMTQHERDDELCMCVQSYVEYAQESYPDYFELYSAVYLHGGLEVAFYDNQQ